MDGDQSAKTFEQGANSAMKDQDLTSGIHESTNQVVSTAASRDTVLYSYVGSPDQATKQLESAHPYFLRMDQ